MSPRTRLTVNGQLREVPEQAGTLLSFLRNDLRLTGAKPGCGEGVCGACTVLVDDEAVRSCVTDLRAVAERSVTTIEGLTTGVTLHPVARAFVELNAMQCGYCTPGMVLSATALLRRNPAPSRAEICSAMAGNICRCCAYSRIVSAIDRAAGMVHEPESAVPMPVAAADLDSAAGEPWDLSELDERNFFEVLGDGLVVVLPPDEERPPRPGRWAMNGGAWIHVGGGGVITAFTGKIDMGEDNRTALSMLVAEELRVPYSAVRLVMGDTAVSPFDIGTFGSRSMPDAGFDLRCAAAAARDWLTRIAAARWHEDAGNLDAADGCVRETGGARSIAYGDLVRDLRRVETVTADPPLTPAVTWRVAGMPAAPVAAIDAVTGARRYTSDLEHPGMLHASVLRPPAAGARLRSVDVTGAASLPGVELVQEPGLVAAVAARPEVARDAVSRINAQWDGAQTVSDSDLVAHLRSHPLDEYGWETAMRHEDGDVDSALAAAATRVQATYTTAYVAHAALETRAALAVWDRDRVTVWVSTQQPFAARAAVAAAVGVSDSSVRVIVPPIGGGFGGKEGADVAVEAARLARATGRPIKVQWSRAEELGCAYFRPAGVIDVRGGIDGSGRITAWDMRSLNAGSQSLESPYQIANRRIEFQPAASPLPQGPYRALAATANTFARESHVDDLAHHAGVDPLSFRLRHLADPRLSAVLRAAAEHAGWPLAPSGPADGMGLACGVEKGGYVASCVTVTVDHEGCPVVRRITTAFECGAIVNPDGLRNQVEGAVVMGLGGALFERVHFTAGQVTGASFAAYRVPRFSDLPELETVLLNRTDLPSAGGGEAPIITVAPAVANAIFAATGRRLRSLPLVPDGRIPTS